MPLSKQTTSDEALEAGRRLTVTRLALGHVTLRSLANAIDWNENLLGKYEAGKVRVPNRVVMKLHDLGGVDQNWIYGGVKRGLPYDLVQKIEAVERSLAAEKA